MKFRLITAFVFLAIPCLSFAQRTEYIQLQRDIALLQDQMRTLQRSMDEKMEQLTLLVQQAMDRVNAANTTLVALENNLRDRLREQEQSVAQPVATMGTKVDQLSTEMLAIRESVSDLAVRFGRLEQQLVDMSAAMRTLDAPPLPPPSGEARQTGPPAGLSGQLLYQNALRDKDGGNFDLALQGFGDYLQYFGTTPLAPNAQYYIGEIHYLRGELAEAAEAFDMVLEKYPENSKTPDAHYMKGMALLKSGQRNNARDEFYTLIRRFPNNELASKARSQLKALGLSPNPPKS